MQQNDKLTPSPDAVDNAAQIGRKMRGAGLKSQLLALNWFGKSLAQGLILVLAFVAGIALVGAAQRGGWIRPRSETANVSDDQDANNSEFTCPMHPQIRQGAPGDCPICGMKLVATIDTKAVSQARTTQQSTDRYVCPMMCSEASSEPGRCPVCAMELVPATWSAGGDGLSVTIEPAARRLIGIQTAIAKLDDVTQTIRTIGSIEYDQSRLATISAYVAGRIEKLYANYVGVPVAKGDDLALIYSPDLYSAQVEFLTALRGGGPARLGNTTNLAELAKQNLIELGLTEEQVSELAIRGTAESRIRIRSPIKGTVIEKYSLEGDYIKTGDQIYQIADLSTVWMMLDVFPADAARIRFGQQIEAEIQSMPGEVFTGRVAFINPTVDRVTRTVRVRVETLNPEGKLRPGDYATARVFVPAIRQDRIYDPMLAGKYISPMHPQIIRNAPGDCPVCGMRLIPTSELGFAEQPLPQQQVVTVPRSAVLMTGENSVIYVETQPGRFEIRRVSIGPLTEGEAVVLEGLAAGETVATEGNFLIDSQMQLAGNPSLTDPSKALRYLPGPLHLFPTEPKLLVGESGKRVDLVFQSYVTVQQALARDLTPPPATLVTLDETLRQLVDAPDVPDEVRGLLHSARNSLDRMGESLEQSREAFRPLSHTLLRAASLVRGSGTIDGLFHMYCPMVAGGGGDWMQSDSELRNPYWGAEMFNCGEVVADLGVAQ